MIVKNILFVCFKGHSLGTSSGGLQRSLFLVEALRKLGEVDILELGGNGYPDYDKPLTWSQEHNFFSPEILVPLEKAHKELLEKQLAAKNYDIVVFRYISTYFSCGLPRLKNMILDMDDLIWNVWRQKSLSVKLDWKRSFFNYLKYRAKKFHGERAAKKFKAIFYSNDTEAEAYKGIYLPNIPYIKNEPAPDCVPVTKHSLFFVGLMGYRPNCEGVDRFVSNVFPRVLEKFPDAVLNIGGKGCPEHFAEKWGKVPNVNLLGFVESLEKAYAESELVVCPIYKGSGTNIKVLEALAYRKPCIISSFAHRGFERTLIPGKDLIVSQTDKDFADNIIAAFENPEKASAIASSGYETVKINYSRNRFDKVVAGIIKSL